MQSYPAGKSIYELQEGGSALLKTAMARRIMQVIRALLQMALNSACREGAYLHGVIDAHASCHRPSGRVDEELDVLHKSITS